MTNNYSEEIEKSTNILKTFRKSQTLFNNEQDILELMESRYKMYHYQIHEYLVELKTEKSENEIQNHIKVIYSLDLPICEAKIEKFKNALLVYEKRKDYEKLNMCYQYLQRWLQLYDDNISIVSFRSFEMFCNYLEMDKRDNEKVWKYSIDPYNDNGYTGVNKPFFYYFNQMVLKKKIKVLTKQQPTGTGKSYGNQFAIAWLFGQDVDNDVLVVLGNPTLVTTNIKSVVELMQNPKYVKVFPIFSKYLQNVEDNKGNIVQKVSDEMFSVQRGKEGELTLADSRKPLNLKVISKDTPIDGIRVKYLFLDDICRSKDAGNLKQHQKDLDNFWNSWWKRNYSTEDFYIVIGATAYSIFDIVSQLIAYYSKGKMKHSTVNKYTFLSLDETCVFIKIPKIDEELNRSTYPQKYSYEEAIKIKNRDLYSFMAMEQQQPLPPDGTPFYVDKLINYDELPTDEFDYCWASLDSARLGSDYNSMAILKHYQDKFYLVDCLYLDKPMEEVYPHIIEKIDKHKITKFVIENNIDTSLKTLLTKMLQEKGITYCEIIEKYSTKNKEAKITEMEYTIKTNIVFPNIGIYANASQMGKFMNDVWGYSYKEKPDHDDSIDSLAIFCEKLIVRPQKSVKAKVLYI